MLPTQWLIEIEVDQPNSLITLLRWNISAQVVNLLERKVRFMFAKKQLPVSQFYAVRNFFSLCSQGEGDRLRHSNNAEIKRNSSRRVATAMALMLIVSSMPLSALAEDSSWPSEDSSKPATSEPASQDEGWRKDVEAKDVKPNPKPSASERQPEIRPHAVAPSQPKAKTTTLFGRIDQIAGEANVSMPVLKAETAKMDTSRQPPLRAAASEARFSGTVATSFPMDFSGTWGGTIRVWRFSVAPLSYEIDAAESNKLRSILSPGTAGDVNFVFRNEPTGKIDLEPAQVRIMIPASQSYSYQQMMQGGGGNLGSMGGMVSQMMANMKVPVVLHFGTVSTRGSMEVGVSGNQIDQQVVKNEIRQLASSVVEEQIVTRNSSVQTSGRGEDGYTESVMRFTRQSPTQLYVLAASVDYDEHGRFLRKLIMYGNVVRGQVMNTSPYPSGMGNISQVIGGGAGAGGMAGLSSILNSMGAATGGASNYSSSMESYANNPEMREYLNNAGGSQSHMEGFGQLMNSLNMLSR